VNLNNDENNCGVCGRVCRGIRNRCVDGECRRRFFDD